MGVMIELEDPSPTPPKPALPVKPENDAVVITGSKTVTVMGSNAARLGDIITVRIDEGDTATSQATTNLSRSNKMEAGVPALLNLTSALTKALPGLDPTKLLSIASSGQHSGQGTTSRSGKVAAVVPARIKRVLPNGDFFVEGSKVLLVNSEEHHLYLSGVVRPVDLAVDNSIVSSRVAEAQVEITGRGVVSEKQNPGWGSRVLDYVWPF